MTSGGRTCECFDDDDRGHWINPEDGCVICKSGWNQPHCTKCAASKSISYHIQPLEER